MALEDDQAFISFTERDLAAFCEASGDRNPLHLDPAYAARTPYGERVVFGCLGALACLGKIRLPEGWVAASLEADFHRPLFLGVAYRVDLFEKEGSWGAGLFDGSIPVSSVTVTARPSREDGAEDGTPPSAAFERQEAAARRPEEMTPGLRVSGKYACNTAAMANLMARWGVEDRRLAVALAWSSYLVGMEMPGECALFSRLSLRFHESAACAAPMSYAASILSVDPRFGQVRMEVSLLGGVSTIASGQCWSYVRPPAPELEPGDFMEAKPDSLAGRVAVLLGSTRGLGAAIERALELRGAAVYGMARSATRGAPAPAELGDSADPQALRRLRERVWNERGRLDFLICNACPPILPLRLEPNAADRIRSYIGLAVSLVLAPLSEFLELLDRGGGCAVIVSSAAVERPVREWPHYIAAKQAAEALGRVACLQYPRVRTLIVRPPKLLTAMTNTPMGRLGAVPPGLFADRIAARLEDPPPPGKAEILA